MSNNLFPSNSLLRLRFLPQELMFTNLDLSLGSCLLSMLKDDYGCIVLQIDFLNFEVATA